MITAATAKDIYAELYTLIAKSAGNAVEFYNTVLRPRDEAELVLLNTSREYPARKKHTPSNQLEPAAVDLVNRVDEEKVKSGTVFRK